MNQHPRRTVNRLALALAVAAVAGVATWLPAQVAPGKLCCIAGEYQGSNRADQLPRCPVPTPDAFTMAIGQSRECGSDVSGRITDAEGHVNPFTGTLTRGQKGCCVLTASFSDPGQPGHVVITGTFCKSGKKWSAKGTYTEPNSSDPCKVKGTWKVTQK
jgi:hypothetical protein